jgi:hypothetical protein
MKIRRFPSGAVRSDDTGRVRPDYLSPYAIKYIAECFSNNSNDFGVTNYFLGIKPADIFPSLSRHYLDLHEALVEGKNDEIKREFASIAQNCIMALHQIIMEEKGLYKEVYEKTELIDKKDALEDKENEIIRIKAKGEVVYNTVNGTVSHSGITTTGSSTSTKYYCKFIPGIARPKYCSICGKSEMEHQTK